MRIRESDRLRFLERTSPQTVGWLGFSDAHKQTPGTLIAVHLGATQRGDGSWQPGVGGDADVYMSAFCALALLAADNESHLPAVKQVIQFIRRNHTHLPRKA